MIRHIIRKEILGRLLSLRFILSLLLIVSLYSASGFMFADKYRQQRDDYWQETNKNLSFLRERTKHLYELALNKRAIWRKPVILTFCAEGFEKSLPDYFSFDIFTVDIPEAKGRSGFLAPHFSDIDWVFIISVVLSFFALLLTYDNICGEKEAGTLRQMLACSIARHEILLGKYVGAMLTLGIPLLVGLLVNLIIVVSSDIGTIGTGDCLRILGIVVMSFLYLSIFTWLGLFVSSRAAHSVSSMVVLLLLWVGLVILIPSLGRVTSGRYDKIAIEIPTYTKLKPSSTTTAEMRDLQSQNLEEHVSRMIAQTQMGRHLTRVSPTVVYQRASEAFAGTGINRCANLYQQIKRYQRNFREYVRTEDAKDSESLHRIFREDPYSLSLILNDKEYIEEWRAVSKEPVDFDTVPKFQQKDLSLGQSLKLAIWDIGLLALFNLVFFAAAFVSFLRYDVR